MPIDMSGIRTQQDILGKIDGSGDGFREFILSLTLQDDGIDGKNINITDPEFLIQGELAPVSLELSNIYIIEDFKNRAIDINALLEVDNDPDYKANLKAALHTTDQGVQAYIDLLFDYHGSNVGKPRKGQDQSIGIQIFDRTSPPTTDIVISSGTRVSSQPTSSEAAVVFETQSTVTMLVAQAASYLNPVTGKWEIPAAIKAVLPGANGNKDAGAINVLVNSIDGISGTRNPTKSNGGQDKESNASYGARIIAAYAGSNTFSKPGRESITLEQDDVSGAVVIGTGNPLMLRDQGGGGKVDIYIQTNNNDLQQATDELHPYTNTVNDYVMTNQPVEGNQEINPVIVKVYANGTLLGTLTYTTHFSLVKDRDNVPINNYVEWSSFAQDKITLTAAGHTYIAGLGIATDLAITYTYDRRIKLIQDIFSAEDGHAAAEDVQVRKAKSAILNVSLTAKLLDGFIVSDVQDSIATILSDLYNINKPILGLGGVRSKIITAIQNAGATIGVDEIEDSTLVLSLVDGNDVISEFDYTADPFSNIDITENEFLQMGTVTLTAVV